MKIQDIVSGIVLLILIYLLVQNAKGTSDVIGALAKGTGSLVESLQGR